MGLLETNIHILNIEYQYVCIVFCSTSALYSIVYYCRLCLKKDKHPKVESKNQAPCPTLAHEWKFCARESMQPGREHCVELVSVFAFAL